MKHLSLTFALALLASPAGAQTVRPGGPGEIACSFNSALPLLAEGDVGKVQCDNRGRLIIANPGAGGGGGSAADQTATNGGTITPTSDNQHSVVFNYGWDPVAGVWDRARLGSAGALLSQITNFPTTQAVTQSGSWTVTANLGTLGGAATETTASGIRTALGSPFQAGGAISNTSFAISGTLPAFASNPTVKLDQTANGVAISAFAPTGQAAITATSTSGSVALGSAGPTALVTNNGAVTAYVAFGASGVSATTSSYPVNAGQSIAFSAGTNTYIAAITASGSAPLSVTSGTGLPAIASAAAASGGGGSGSTGSVTAAGTNGSVAQAVQGINNGVPLPVKFNSDPNQNGVLAYAQAIYYNTTQTMTNGTFFPLLSNAAGALKVDSSGTTSPVNNAQINGVTLATGSGATSTGTQRVVLATDQTSVPVTGNFYQATQPVSGSVSLTGTLPAYAAIPTFKVDQTTPGTTNKVSIGTDGTVSVGNFPATQPISAASLPLPSGASTAALQSNVQSAAGTAAGTAIGTQGVTGGVPQPVLPSSITPTRTAVSLSATTSTSLVAANANRRALQVTCDGTAVVGISQTGGTLTAATLAGGADTLIPASSANTYIPPFATKSAVTAYTGTAQTCVVLEWTQS